MAAQTEYNRGTSFTDAQAAAPSTPPSGPALDAEYDRIKLALDSTQQNLDLIQRDDGALANNSVGIDQIDPAIYTGLRPATLWAPVVNYVVNDTAFFGSASTVSLYRCLVSHTSSIFANDLAAGRWLLLFSYTPPVTVGITPLANGGTGATDAAGARANLGLGPLATATGVAINQGGTGATDSTSARANLGLAIGVDILAYDAKLAAEAALSPIADRLSFYTGPTTKNTTPFASSARSLLSLSPVADRMPYFSGSSTAALAVLTAAARALLDDPDVATMLTTLGATTLGSSIFKVANVAALWGLAGIQRGSGVTTASGVTVAFSPAFTSTPIILVSPNTAGAGFITFQAQSASSFVAQGWNTAAVQTNLAFNWLAIGT